MARSSIQKSKTITPCSGIFSEAWARHCSGEELLVPDFTLRELWTAEEIAKIEDVKMQNRAKQLVIWYRENESVFRKYIKSLIHADFWIDDEAAAVVPVCLNSK